MGNLVIALPAWFLDRLMPLLTPPEFKLAVYIASRTWSRRKPWAMLTVAQMARGSWLIEDRLDYGTGMSHNVVNTALATLRKYKVAIDVTKRREMKGMTGKPLRMGWYKEIDWNGLQERMQSEKMIRMLRLNKLDPDMEWLQPKLPAHAKKQARIEEVFASMEEKDYRQLLLKREEEKMQKEIEGKPFDGNREQREGEYIPGVPYPKNRIQQEPEYLARARKMGVDAAVAVKISQVLLDLTGRSMLADQETDYGYKALSEAHQAAVTVIGLGRRTVAAAQDLDRLWMASWQVDKAIKEGKAAPLPTMKQVIDLAAANPPGPYEFDEQPATETRQITAGIRHAPVPVEAEPEVFTMTNLFD